MLVNGFLHLSSLPSSRSAYPCVGIVRTAPAKPPGYGPFTYCRVQLTPTLAFSATALFTPLRGLPRLRGGVRFAPSRDFRLVSARALLLNRELPFGFGSPRSMKWVDPNDAESFYDAAEDADRVLTAKICSFFDFGAQASLPLVLATEEVLSQHKSGQTAIQRGQRATKSAVSTYECLCNQGWVVESDGHSEAPFFLPDAIQPYAPSD